MRTHVVLICALALVGCKKTGTGTGGGGGGGWLVGSDALMAQVDPHGKLGAGYDLGSQEQLQGIACRYSGEAWVVGTHATLLYTSDAGTTWSPQVVPTTADLRALATQDNGPVFVGGDGVFLVSTDTGASWKSLGDAVTKFRSIAAAQSGDTVLALGDDGSLWSYDATSLARTQSFAGAHAVAVSADGAIAMIAGHGLSRSSDGGVTWQALATDLAFDDVRIAEDGSAVAVGAGGMIANIDPSGHVSTQQVGTADLHTLHIADADSPDAAGYAAGDGGQVLITQDFGASWTLGPNLGRTVWSVDVIGTGHR
ncbi:MAG: hypothetical protein JWO36_6344 [Myxococcales bacterium]|nr:hypothetical protein [Myxococcales bacterium]